MPGKIALSDAEKKRRGTFDPRYSEAARASKVVQLFGDPLDAIPEPPPNLHEKAVKEYWRWCNVLHQMGRLTSLQVDKIRLYAIAKHSIEKSLFDGKMPRETDMRIERAFLNEMSGINADTPITQGGPAERKFAHFGFAGRVQPPKASPNRG